MTMRWAMFQHNFPPGHGKIPSPFLGAHLIDERNEPVHPVRDAQMVPRGEVTGFVVACAECMRRAVER